MGDAVKGLQAYNSRRKLKGAVQALAGAVLLDPLYYPDSDSNFLSFYKNKNEKLIKYFHVNFSSQAA